MPLVLTPRRADWQRRSGESEPCHPGVRRAGVAQPVGRVCAGSGEPVPAAPGLGRLASLRAPGRGLVPSPTPLLREPGPRRAKGGAASGTERPVPGGRGKQESGGPGESRSRAGRRAMEKPRGGGRPDPAPQARLRSGGARGRRGPAGRSSGTESPSNARPRSPGAPGRAARPPRHAEVCPSLLGLIVLARFLSPPPPPGLPLRALRRGPLPSPSSPPSSSPSPGLALPSPHSGLLSRAHTFFLTHARKTHSSPSPRARARSPRLPLSLSLWPALQPFKMLPLPCDSPAAAPRPPARSPAPSLARFLSLALPLPTSDLLH